MGELDQLLEAIGQLHAAGLDASLWPAALATIAALLGGVAATLEHLDRRTMAYIFFSAHGVPPRDEIAYLDEFAALNPRVAAGLKQKPGELAWDYQVLDEAGMDRDPFHANFLKPMGMRYSTAAVLKVPATEFAALAVQRAPEHGHVGERELKLMRTLEPHASQVLEVTRRLTQARRSGDLLGEGLDWIADGVVVLDAEGRVIHSNQAAQALARRGDGFALAASGVELADRNAQTGLDAAIAAIAALRLGISLDGPRDFVARRPSGRPYAVAVRSAASHTGALAFVFIHDPDADDQDQSALLIAAFGLTTAEAQLAEALRGGTPAERYAELRGLSPNTVYTHLRRIKDKVGENRTVALLRVLNAITGNSARPV